MHAKCARFIGSLLLGLLPATTALARDLSFEERVEAQKAIETVYYRHQLGAIRAFEVAVPDHVLEEKVRGYLKQSAALERYWRTPITREALRREMERIARHTRFPGRLEEIYRALDDDPFLIQECFARPILVNRLARNFFTFDRAIHRSSRRRAEALRQQLRTGFLDSGDSHPLRTLVEVGSPDSDPQRPGPRPERGGPHARGAELGEQLFRVDESYLHRHAVPAEPGIAGPVIEEKERFTFSVLLDGNATPRVATYNVAKASWGEWWHRNASRFREEERRAVASDEDPLPTPGRRADASDALASAGAFQAGPAPDSEPAACSPDDTWDNGILDDVPDGRHGHPAIWTGTEMIVWGGLRGTGKVTTSTILQTGGRYDPLTDTWVDISMSNAPSPRWDHAAVWTGDRMIVWGGRDGLGNSLLNSGGQYDPIADSWTATSLLNAPAGRFNFSAVWTGSEMIIWGGTDDMTGARYDPVADTWTPTSTVNAPVARAAHSAVWSGSQMIVWGGGGVSASLNDGGRYDPTTDSWLPTMLGGAPTPRSNHSAVWTGNRMLIWGGGWPLTDSGGLYDPVSDSWSPTSTVNAPSARLAPSAVWSGDSLLIWGGVAPDSTTPLDTGARYDPASGIWTAMSTGNAPSPRTGHTAIWAGDRMIAWGGWDYLWRHYGTGGRYDPVGDVWTPTSIGSGPVHRSWHTSIWTGTLMVVWGGRATEPQFHDTGGRYDLLTNSWSPTSTVGAPTERNNHTAIWTGDRMVIWGGVDGSGHLATGGRYDPVADVWTPVATANAPPASSYHIAVWSGDEMIVWGGIGNYGYGAVYRNTGGRYDPVTNAWVPTATIGAPSARSWHSAIWTGSEMIVWGGRNGGGAIDTGARYDLVSDSWTPISLANVPLARNGHSTVWTGSEMIVWSGVDDQYRKLLVGGRYDPAADAWDYTSTFNAPDGRAGQQAIWTGRSLVVWGGTTDRLEATGGRYDPIFDSWTATSLVNAPLARSGHSAVWTGESMLIWGGSDEGGALGSGGRYFVMNDPDGDCLTAGVDNCPLVSNPDQHDTDFDGSGDVCDCAPGDPSAYADPEEDITLRWDSTSLLRWTSLAAAAGPGILYDLCQGYVGPQSMMSDEPDICLTSASPDTTMVIPAVPGSGEAFYYFARGTNACNTASFGWDTEGNERPAEVCE